MRHFCRSTLFAAALVMVAGEAAAQAMITEVEFLAALREDHPAILGLTDRLADAEGARERAGRLSNPRVAAAWELPEETTQQQTWSVAWTPPFDGRRSLRRRSTEAAFEAAKADLESAQLETRGAMRAVYARWALSAERLGIGSALHERVERLVAQMTSRAESGEASGLAARRLELAGVEIEAAIARTRAEEARARRLAAAWSAAAENRIPARPELPEPPNEIDVASKPEIRARELDVAAAQYEEKLSGRFLDFPELEAGWQRQEDPSDEEHSGPVFGGSWAVPLFNRQQGDRAQAGRRLAAAEARHAFALTLAQAEAAGAIEAYAALRESALRSLAAVAETDGLVEAATASYSLGESTLTDLLETLRSTVAGRMAALDLYEAALEAHRNLEIAAGRALSGNGGR